MTSRSKVKPLMRRHVPNNTLVAYAAICLIGCGGCLWEPYPALTTEIVPFGRTPKPVRESFLEAHEERSVVSVEETVFHSKWHGYRKFRFHLQDGQSVTLDEDGQPTTWTQGAPPK